LKYSPTLTKPTYPSALDRLRKIYNIKQGERRKPTQETWLNKLEASLIKNPFKYERISEENYVKDGIKSLQEDLPEPITVEGIVITKKGICVKEAVWLHLMDIYPATKLKFKHRRVGNFGVIMFIEDFIDMVSTLKKSFRGVKLTATEIDGLTVIKFIEAFKIESN
jgi:hypothetical protein